MGLIDAIGKGAPPPEEDPAMPPEGEPPAAPQRNPDELLAGIEQQLAELRQLLAGVG